MPEYNRGYNAALKNAIDYLYAEWEGLPVGCVGYGWHGASYAKSALRQTLERVKMTVVDGPGLEFGKTLTQEGEVTRRRGRRSRPSPRCSPSWSPRAVPRAEHQCPRRPRPIRLPWCAGKSGRRRCPRVRQRLDVARRPRKALVSLNPAAPPPLRPHHLAGGAVRRRRPAHRDRRRRPAARRRRGRPGLGELPVVRRLLSLRDFTSARTPCTSTSPSGSGPPTACSPLLLRRRARAQARVPRRRPAPPGQGGAAGRRRPVRGRRCPPSCMP